MIWHLLLRLQSVSCHYGQLFSSRLSNLYSDAIAMFTDAQLLLALPLVDNSLLPFPPASEEYSENIPPKIGP